ncbi:MAG TPA: RHS repeat-associated core domain-containing protein, partial [Leptospiraceae bacterium]|nr:RHS repeat-associated core domain-containing protein [Leptospiraceae bacterium]
MDDDSGNEIARYNYDFSGQRAKKILKDGSIVYSFDGIFEIAVPNGKPQQQTLLVKGYKGEIAGQMTDLSATLLTSADIEKEKQYAFLLPFRNTFHSFKHFVNRHIVASPAFLYAGHSSLDYILSYNSFSWKAKTGAFLILLMILYIFLYKHSGHIQKEEEYSSARFFRLTSPAVTMGFLMTFVLQSCTGLSHHSSQTPWAALGAAAINANTPAIGDVPGFGTPGEGGSSHAGSAIASGAGTPVEGMYFFHNDNIMSTKVLSNAAGEAVTGSNGASRLIYNPYGDINTDYSKGPDIVRRKYTGQELDNESGLYYYNARYYDPALGRFITADSIGNVGGPNGDNRYMYVSGNPMKFNDPDGHKETQWHKNMMKDLKAAMIDKAIDVVGLPAAALYMLQKQKDKRDYYKKTMIERNAAGWFDRQVVNPIQHMNGTELLIGA